MDDSGPSSRPESEHKMFLRRIFSRKSANDEFEDEIISMVNEGHEQGVLQESEAKMITNIFEFGDKEARDIMTHRTAIIGIDKELPLKEALNIMLTESNSRYPVYDGNIDHIIGILHLKDAMRAHEIHNKTNEPICEIDGLIREAKFIPETRHIDTLFHYMQSNKIHMVVVIDEYGQTAGLVAMEDILEEIVGNILDEYDEEELHINRNSDNEYVVDGMTSLEELGDTLFISFEDENFGTLNGFIISKLEKIPTENEEFDFDYKGYNFKVLSVENRMIKSVLVKKTADNEDINVTNNIDEE